MSETLNEQINEFKHKEKESAKIVREWKEKPKVRENTEHKIKRTRKINETSPQNVLVKSFSPDVIIESEHAKKCIGCTKFID